MMVYESAMEEGAQKFLVIMEQDDRGTFVVHCPAVQCSSQGDDRADALEMIVDAIQGMLEAYEELKESNPSLVPLPLAETSELIADAVRETLEFRVEYEMPMTLEIVEVVVPAQVLV